MLSRPLQRTALSGLLIGLALVAAMVGAGFDGSMPAASSPLDRPLDGPLEAPMGPADETPSSASRCRLVATPLSWERDAGRIVLRGRLQNAGQDPSLPRALQATWTGDARLSRLQLGQAEMAVDAAESPALIDLTELDAELLPDQPPLELILVFEGDDASAWAPGPMLLILDGGCEVSLGTGEDPSCALNVSEPLFDAAVEGRVRYQLRNEGQSAIDLAALELDWPATDNGALLGLRIDREGSPLDLDLLAKRPPAVIDLQRGLGQRLTLAGQEQLDLELRFERAAAEKGYSLAVLGAGGCRADSSTWLASPSCGTVLESLDMGRRSATMLLSNRRGITQTLTSLDLIWQPEHQGRLDQILIDGRILHDRPIEDSPARILLARPLPIGPGRSVELKLSFAALSTEPGGGELPGLPGPDPVLWATGQQVLDQVADGDLSLIAHFRGGCYAVATTLRGQDDLGCRVTASDLLPRQSDEQSVEVRLDNSGSDAFLQSLLAAWPVHNGALTSLRLGDIELLEQALPHSAEPLRIELTQSARLPRGASQTLRLGFAEDAVRGPYSLSLDFENGAGEPCAELLVTSPPMAPECALNLAEPSVLPDDKTVEMELRNAGPDPLEFESLRITWPSNGGMSTMRLRSLTLIDAGEDEQRLLDQANQSTPVFVRVSETVERPVTLAAGQRATVQLIFDEIREPVELVRGLKTSIAFVEGCEVAYPPGDNVIGPDRLRLEARITELPEAGIYGDWLLRDLERARPWRVRVDRGTQFVPANVRPQPGDVVLIEAQQLQTVNLADKVTFLVSQPERKFLGRVSQVRAATPPALLPQLEVDGQPIRLVEGFTVVDRLEDLVVGAIVQVQGATGQDGSFVASRVEIVRADDESEHAVAFRGVVQWLSEETSGSPFENVAYLFVVDEHEVHVPSALAATIQRPVPGRPVEVEGMRRGHQVRAESIRDLPTPEPPARVEGTILNLPAGGLLGTWTLDLGQPGATRPYTFTVGNVAVVDERRAPAATGMRAEVTIRPDDEGMRHAVRLRTDWP